MKRKNDREQKRAKYALKSAERSKDREEYEKARAEEIAERAKQIKEEREERIAAGDPRALMLREKSLHGNRSALYWDLFAQVDRDAAESAGTVSRTIVNGIDVYADHFGESVLESIERHGSIRIETVKRF